MGGSKGVAGDSEIDEPTPVREPLARGGSQTGVKLAEKEGDCADAVILSTCPRLERAHAECRGGDESLRSVCGAKYDAARRRGSLFSDVTTNWETFGMPAPFEHAAAAHRFFAADCFNNTWTLLDKPERTAADEDEMLQLAMASLWHWRQRADCTNQNLSVGYWQVSRVLAVTRQASLARHYAELCLAHSAESEPFYRGYAFEALSRAAAAQGDHHAAAIARLEAQRLALLIDDAESRTMLETDLQALANPPGDSSP